MTPIALRQLFLSLSFSACLWWGTPFSPALALNGPMQGSTELSSVQIWLQSEQTAELKLHYWPAEQPEQKRWSATVQTLPDQDFSTTFLLEGLKPGTRYIYQVWENGQQAKADQTFAFRTQSWRGELPTLKIALGSCVYINDPEVDLPGQELGGDYTIFGEIAKKQPDLMLWMGDNVYLRPPDYFSRAAIARRYRQLRSLPELQPLLASTAHYAIWDDHDYGDNDSDRTYRLRSESLAVFQQAWANPSYGLPETPGIFSHFQWADVAFFLTDNRYHRAPNALQDPNKDFFGPDQWRWLKESLAASKATFKLVVLGNQTVNTQAPSENMYSYARAYNEFLTWLDSSGISGIVLLSGDRHHSEFFQLERPGNYPLHEWTVSPLTGKAYPPFAVETHVPTRLPGSLLQERNFGLLEVTGPPKARKLILRLFDAQGQPRWQHELSEQQLRQSRP